MGTLMTAPTAVAVALMAPFVKRLFPPLHRLCVRAR